MADHLPEVLSVARHASLFAFLDPFGLALDFGLVRSGLLGRPPSPPTEVLLHFSVSAIARMGRAVQVAQSRGGRLAPAEQKTADHLTRFLGDDWWQEHFARVHGDGDEETATEVALRVGAEYEKRLTTGTSYSAVTHAGPTAPGTLTEVCLDAVYKTHRGRLALCRCRGPSRRGLRGSPLRKPDEPGHPVWVTSVRSPGTRGQCATTGGAGCCAEHHSAARGIEPMHLAERVPEVYRGVLGQAWTRHARHAVKALHRQGLIDHTGVGDFWKDPIRQL